MLISGDDLTRLIGEIFVRVGCDEGEARQIAENLLTANLMGHDSHGIFNVPRYIAAAQDGRAKIGQHIEVVSENGPFLLLEGNMGFGQVIGREAMERGIAVAREHRVAIVGLRNTHHLGRIGAWAELCIAQGLISIHYVNVTDHEPIVAPYGGSDARITTDPYCTAFPATAGPPIILDMATAKLAMGKVRVAYNKGEQVPEGSLIDSAGRPTTDPGVMVPDITGALCSMGEHKGYGLALVCEILAGALTGGGVFRDSPDGVYKIRNNMLSILIDPAGFGEAIPFAGEIDKLTAWVKASPPAPGVEEVMVPGDPERKTRAEREKSGIPIDETTWAALVETGVSLGLDQADFERAVLD